MDLRLWLPLFEKHPVLKPKGLNPVHFKNDQGGKGSFDHWEHFDIEGVCLEDGLVSALIRDAATTALLKHTNGSMYCDPKHDMLESLYNTWCDVLGLTPEPIR